MDIWTKYQQDACCGKIPFWVETFKRSDKALKLKMNKLKHKYGFYPIECVDLDITIMYLVLPYLRYFREHVVSCPHNMTRKEYLKTLDDIIKAMQRYITDTATNKVNYERDIKPALYKLVDILPTLWDWNLMQSK